MRKSPKVALLPGLLSNPYYHNLYAYLNLIISFIMHLGSYSEWNHANTASETYCDQIPFSFAMGALIANWILLLVRGIPSSMKHVHSDYVAL